MEQFVITVTCPDRQGIIAAVTGVLAESGANILDLTQHTASDVEVFMLKGLFEVPAPFDRGVFEAAIGRVAEEFGGEWELLLPGELNRRKEGLRVTDAENP